MGELSDLKVHINGQHTFLVNQRILCAFSGKVRKMVEQEKKTSQTKGSGLKIMGFPGGPDGFELVSRFCYNKGRIPMNPSNICLLHCSAIFLDMTEEVSNCNLLSQAETFLDGLFYWTWDDILTALKNCESFFPTADSSGLLHKLISSLLAKISANSESKLPAAVATPLPSSSSSSSSPDTSGFRFCSLTKTPDPMKPCSRREWWFEDLTILAPNIIEKIMKTLGAYGADNKNLILTRFLLHYLRTAAHKRGCYKVELGGLVDTAVHGVVLMGRVAFSCRGLFWVHRLVSGLGLRRECRDKLEMVMGSMLEQATLDDLLVSGHNGGVYDVNLVLRLLRYFVGAEESVVSLPRMKKVGRLVDKYLREISPDQSLKVSKFLGVAESLPESTRDCFDEVYRALDIYLESHPALSSEECVSLCQCLNYEKLSLGACKDLAKNPRIPPEIAIQALVSQQSKLQIKTSMTDSMDSVKIPRAGVCAMGCRFENATPVLSEEKQDLRINLKGMQNRVMEQEKVCRAMKGQMSKMAKSKSINSPTHHSSRGMPRLC